MFALGQFRTAFQIKQKFDFSEDVFWIFSQLSFQEPCGAQKFVSLAVWFETWMSAVPLASWQSLGEGQIFTAVLYTTWARFHLYCLLAACLLFRPSVIGCWPVFPEKKVVAGIKVVWVLCGPVNFGWTSECLISLEIPDIAHWWNGWMKWIWHVFSSANCIMWTGQFLLVCLHLSTKAPIGKNWSRKPWWKYFMWFKCKNPMPPVSTNYQHHKGCRSSLAS